MTHTSAASSSGIAKPAVVCPPIQRAASYRELEANDDPLPQPTSSRFCKWWMASMTRSCRSIRGWMPSSRGALCFLYQCRGHSRRAMPAARPCGAAPDGCPAKEEGRALGSLPEDRCGLVAGPATWRQEKPNGGHCQD